MTAQEIWSQLTDVTVNEDDEIDTPFLTFPAGTDRKAIWSWIEDEFDVSIHDLMWSEWRSHGAIKGGE